MIDVIKQTPAVYSKESRDYQVIARLYTALFNISKMYIDNLDIWSDNIDNKLTTLRARTLNFVNDHDWDLDDLEAVTSCFKYLMRNKGTVAALKYVISILMKIERVDGKISSDTVSYRDNMLTIRIEKSIMTLGIMEDLVKYLLPAGLVYRIIEYRSIDLGDVTKTDLYMLSQSDDLDTINWKTYSNSYKMYIGNDTSKKRYINKTFVYNDTDMINWTYDRDTLEGLHHGVTSEGDPDTAIYTEDALPDNNEGE